MAQCAKPASANGALGWRRDQLLGCYWVDVTANSIAV